MPLIFVTNKDHSITQHSFYLYAGIMLLAGLGIPIMAALNGGLGIRLHNPAFASTILFIVAGLLSVLYLLVFGPLPKAISSQIPLYYSGGAFVIFYILTITWVAPRFGIGNAIAFVLLGQLISMSVIDHFQLFGAPLHPINPVRLSGLMLMAVGVFLAVQR